MDENKQEYVDTQERIDTFEEEAWQKLSFRSANALKMLEIDTPTKLKAFVESGLDIGIW